MHDLSHHRLGSLIRVFKDHCKSADPLNQRHHIRLSKFLFKQHQISFPVPELATVSDIIRAEQDTDIAVKFGLSTSSGAARWEISPQIIALAFLGIDIAIDCFLAVSQRRAFMDHPVSDLLWRPTVLDAFNNKLAQLRMFNQLALARSSFGRHQLSGGTIVAITFGHTFIAEMITP